MSRYFVENRCENFFSFAFSAFPALLEELGRLDGVPEEVHLRRGRPASYVLAGKNHVLPLVLTETEIEDCFLRLAGGSVYAYRETLCHGYLPLPGGYRVGVAGRGVTEGGLLTGVTEVTELCLRIPRRCPGIEERLFRLWESEGASGGILICGAPGAGKTTLLRELLHRVSETRRTVVVDTRGELCLSGVGTLLTPMTGYPPADAMEIALRTLSPEILATDEVGEAERRGVEVSRRRGVPLFATVHGAGRADLEAHPTGRELLSSGAFRYLAVLGCVGGKRRYTVEELSC